MGYAYLVGSVFLVAASVVFGTLYNRINEKAPCTVWLHNFLICFGALIVWGINCLTSYKFIAIELVYSAIFAIGFCAVYLCMMIALKNGSTSLTSLMLQLSLVGVTIWGFIFWNEKITGLVVAGLVITVIALIFCLYEKNSEHKKINIKWLLSVAIMFIANAVAAIANKTFILTYGEEYNNSMMFFSLLFATIICFIIFMISNKTNVKTAFKRSWYVPFVSGLCNGVHNTFVGLMAVLLPSGVVYPVIAIGGLAVSIVAALFIFKEKLERVQWIGIALGAVAVLLLNL